MGLVRAIEFEKDGVIYRRCKECKNDVFRSTTKIISPYGDNLYSQFSDIGNAVSKGYKLKRFTIIN